MYGHDAVVHTLLTTTADVNLRDKDGATTLLLAAISGHVKIVRYLLKRKDIEVNCGNNQSYTPLMAAKRGSMDIVRLLLAHPAIEPDLEDDSGNTAYSLAANDEIKELLSQQDTQSEGIYSWTRCPECYATKANRGK